LEPAAAAIVDDAGDGWRGKTVPGVVIVNATVFEGPDAFDTETPADPGNAASWARSKPKLARVVERGRARRTFPVQPAMRYRNLSPVTVSVTPSDCGRFRIERVRAFEHRSVHDDDTGHKSSHANHHRIVDKLPRRLVPRRLR